MFKNVFNKDPVKIIDGVLCYDSDSVGDQFTKEDFDFFMTNILKKHGTTLMKATNTFVRLYIN